MFRAIAKGDYAGFQVTLDNGYTVSVMFGYFTYSSNSGKKLEESSRGFIECNNAEIAVITPDGDVLEPEGYCNAEDLISILNETSKLT